VDADDGTRVVGVTLAVSVAPLVDSLVAVIRMDRVWRHMHGLCVRGSVVGHVKVLLVGYCERLTRTDEQGYNRETTGNAK
jgi:hypothetical protein